jgi:hypothetical protein
MASYLCIDASKFYCVGLEINANHLRGLRSGRVTAVAKAIHIGRTTHVWDIRLTSDDGKASCVSRLTMAVVPLGRIRRRVEGDAPWHDRCHHSWQLRSLLQARTYGQSALFFDGSSVCRSRSFSPTPTGFLLPMASCSRRWRPSIRCASGAARP